MPEMWSFSVSTLGARLHAQVPRLLNYLEDFMTNPTQVLTDGVGWKRGLGVMLRSARETRGWSLSEAAEMLGCTKPHLHDMETHRSANPTLRMLAAFVVVYGLRPEALIATAISNGDDITPNAEARVLNPTASETPAPASAARESQPC